MTKAQSVNYTAPNTNFPIASEAADKLLKEDVFTLQRALEDHTHDNTRGTGVRRVNVSAAPGQPGQIQIEGDNLRWWGSLVGEAVTAATLEGDQTWVGRQTFNEPLSFLQTAITPAAPGLGTTVLYSKPDGLLYKRSGTDIETPVGSPPGISWIAKGMDTLGTPGTWAELRQIVNGYDLDWVLSYDGVSNEGACFAFPIPYGYVGTPIKFYVQYRSPIAATGNIALAILGSVTGSNQNPNQALTTVAAPLAVAVPAVAGNKGLMTLLWTATLPTANAWFKGVLLRDNSGGLDTVSTDIDVYGLTVAFG